MPAARRPAEHRRQIAVGAGRPHHQRRLRRQARVEAEIDQVQIHIGPAVALAAPTAVRAAYQNVCRLSGAGAVAERVKRLILRRRAASPDRRW